MGLSAADDRDSSTQNQTADSAHMEMLPTVAIPFTTRLSTTYHFDATLVVGSAPLDFSCLVNPVDLLVTDITIQGFSEL